MLKRPFFGFCQVTTARFQIALGLKLYTELLPLVTIRYVKFQLQRYLESCYGDLTNSQKWPFKGCVCHFGQFLDQNLILSYFLRN